MKIAAVIQARTKSERLPKKVLLKLPYNSDVTVLHQVIRRLKKSKKLDDIILATTVEDDDNILVDIARNEGINYFRGNKDNVLERYYFAARKYKVDVIVRITSDCPCVDAKILDMVVNQHLEKKADFTSNTLERTFPHGLDIEVINYGVLEKAFYNATEKYEKEHVCPYIYITKPELFKINIVRACEKLYAPDIRATIDTIEDYTLLCAVFDYLYYTNNFFDGYDLINLFHNKPWLKNINKNILQKRPVATMEEEIEDAKKLLKLQGLNKVYELLEGILKNK
jgi:spore coat polysaccharide biosynthesis protein SpsF